MLRILTGCGVLALVVGAAGAAQAQAQAQAQADASGAGAGARAWQQLEPYRAPDFEGYFPDDAEDAKELDALWKQGTLRELDDEAYIAAVRRGLRNSKSYRTSIVRELGGRLIKRGGKQHPEAIELCYHAADYREQVAQYGTRHFAVYFGLAVVDQKTPAVLRTLADLCVAIDDPNDSACVLWSIEPQLEELLVYLQPHLASSDPYVKAKAEALERIWRGELGAFEWAAQRAKQPARPRPWSELPEVRATLRTGDSAARVQLFERIRTEQLTEQMNDSYLADFAVAATDSDAKVREELASLVGGHWIWGAGLHLIPAEAVELLLQLSRDTDPDVRYTAVYYGISVYRGENDEVVRRAIDLLLSLENERSRSRLLWGLERFGERPKALLEADLRGPDAARARAAYALYKRLFDDPPPVVPVGIAQPVDLVGNWKITLLAPAKLADRELSLPLVQADDGSILGGPPDDPQALVDLLTSEVGATLHFSFKVGFEDTVCHINGRIENNQASGSARLDALDDLIVWRAVKAE